MWAAARSWHNKKAHSLLFFGHTTWPMVKNWHRTTLTLNFKSFFFRSAEETGNGFWNWEVDRGQSVFPNSDLFIDNLLTQACKPDYSVDDIFRRDSHRPQLVMQNFVKLTRGAENEESAAHRQKKPIQWSIMYIFQVCVHLHITFKGATLYCVRWESPPRLV